MPSRCHHLLIYSPQFLRLDTVDRKCQWYDSRGGTRSKRWISPHATFSFFLFPFFKAVRPGQVRRAEECDSCCSEIRLWPCAVDVDNLLTDDATPIDVPHEHQRKKSTNFFLGLGMWIGYFANRSLCVRELIYWNSSDIK